MLKASPRQTSVPQYRGNHGSSFTSDGDGVVGFQSTTMDDVESELVVDALHQHPHDQQDNFEVRRILLEHLHDVDSGNRQHLSSVSFVHECATAGQKQT